MQSNFAVGHWIVLAGALAAPAAGFCQATAPADPPTDPAAQSAPAPNAADIVVVGDRRSVTTALKTMATFDAATIAATGATSISELLSTIRGVTQSADGQDPIVLLNAQRVSGYAEIGNLPPEAVEKIDVLPEPVALQYGYPPTRRVVNVITKRHFRQIAVKGVLGTSTGGGADNATTHVDFTRLHDDARLTLSLEARHTAALWQSSRHVLPDPDVPFDARGNVTGTLSGGEIDPALSALAGQTVTIAPVPGTDPTLAGFAAGANQPRLFDLSPQHTLAPANDTFHGEAVLANHITHALAGALTLTADHSRDVSVYGPASATLLVPASNPFSPFANAVLLQRYLTEAAPLGQRFDTTTLHAGGVLRSSWHGWQWDATGTLDFQRKDGVSGTAIDLTAANAAIAAGADPFQPLAAALVADPLVNRTVQITHGAGTKFVATNRPLRLPAGSLGITATVEAERTDSDATTRGANSYAVAFGRTRVEGGVALDVPLTSRREDVLAWAGDMSATASAALRNVGGFGTLSDSTAGLTWAPTPTLQILAQLKYSATAPTLDQLATPQASVPQVSLFDFVTGHSALVTLLTGGNPALAAEHRAVRSLGATLKPFANRELRVSATYEATRIDNGVQTIYALTAATQAALPDLFVRDASGTLTAVAYRPTNVFRERQQLLNLTLNTYGQLGHAKPPARSGAAPSDRANYYGGIGPTVRFSDTVLLRPGAATLDVLSGNTLSGATAPRLAGYGYGGLNYRGNSGTFDFYCTGAATIAGAVAASTLAFAPLCKINLSGSLSLDNVLSHQAWTQHLGLKIEVSNVTDAHQQVRDATGAVPYRYQPDLLDPLGRTLAVTLRKLF